MRHGERHGKPRNGQIENRQAEPKQLAKNNALGKPRSNAATDARRDLFDRSGNFAFVARLYGRDAVSHHHPLDIRILAVGHQPSLAAVPYKFGIEAGAAGFETFGMAFGEQIEVEKTVIDG